jgi:hypothetical protein
VSHKAAASRRCGHVYDESIIRRVAGELPGERKIQRSLYLSAQLLGLLLYPSTSVSLPMLCFLQGPFKLRID